MFAVVTRLRKIHYSGYIIQIYSAQWLWSNDPLMLDFYFVSADLGRGTYKKKDRGWFSDNILFCNWLINKLLGFSSQRESSLSCPNNYYLFFSDNRWLVTHDMWHNIKKNIYQCYYLQTLRNTDSLVHEGFFVVICLPLTCM